MSLSAVPPSGRSDQPRSFFSRTWVKVTGAILAVIILLVVIVPFFVNADTFRPTIESQISSALGRKVTLGHLSFSLLTGSLVADQVAIADDPAFSTSPFFQAKSLHIGVSTGALVLERRVHITHFTVDAPQVHLISGRNGLWNFSSIGSGSAPSESGESSGASNVSIGEVKINNGIVDISSQGQPGPPTSFQKVNVTVQNLSYTTPMPFDVSAALPANGTLHLSGAAGPIAKPNAVNTPLHASLQVRSFNPVACGAVPPSSGISTVADVDGQVVSNGRTVSTSGKIKASQLKLSPHGTPASQPVDVDFNITQNLGTEAGQVSDIAVHTGAMAAHVNGVYQLAPGGTTLNLHLSAPGLPIDGIEQLLPAAGITLPKGSSLQGGTLTANLAITGPAAGPQIAGPVSIDNTQLAGFAMASRIQGLASKTSGGNSTQIRTVRANVVNTPQSTQLNQIYGDLPGLGTATGKGVVDASGGINFQLLAKLSSTGPLGAALNSVGGIAGTFLHSASNNGIPISITGTTSNPAIRADLAAAFGQKSGTGQKSNTPGGFLKGLIGK
jgi:AsmA protein